MHHERFVAVIPVKRKGNQLLFFLRKFRDYWGFPKAQVRYQDVLENAAVSLMTHTFQVKNPVIHPDFRETLTFSYSQKGDPVLREEVYFLCHLVTSPRVKLRERYGWFTLGEARTLIRYDNLRDLLERAHQFLQATLL